MPKAKSKSKSGAMLPIDPIPFVRQSTTTSSQIDNPGNFSLHASISGKDARSFYESVVQLNEDIQENNEVKPQQSQVAEPEKPRKKKIRKAIKNESGDSRSDKAQPVVKDYFKMRNALFLAAEKGNIKEIKDLLEQGADVNCQDQYGWTALMCAAHSGHSEAVTSLLDCGGNASIRTTKGQSAWDIAHSAKKHKVLHALTNHGKKDETEDEDVIVEATFLCEICSEQVSGTTKEKHNASTVHQLNMEHPVNDVAYGIPGHNRGFQLMLKSGWDQDKGLGPSGTGQKYPVKTHLKRDRKGLGVKVKDAKPKVTHFQPFDKKAIQHKHRQERAATLSKRAASKKAKKEKEQELRFRMEWTDCP